MPRKVVIVDDSAFLMRQVKDFFEQQMGLEVVAVGKDGNEAVALFRDHRPDLITMDLTMPNKDGRAAIVEILALFPFARILVISAVKGNTMLECMKMGARGYVEKPLKFHDPLFVEDFKKSVEEALSE